MHPLEAWLRDATAEQKARVFKVAHTSAASVYNLMHRIRTGKPLQTSAGFAARVADAIAAENPTTPVLRSDLCEACRMCPYAPKCTQK